MEWNDEKKKLEFQAISRLNDASVHRLHTHMEVRVTKEWDMWVNECSTHVGGGGLFQVLARSVQILLTCFINISLY